MTKTDKKSKKDYGEGRFLDSLIINTVLSGALVLFSRTSPSEEKIQWISPILFLLISYVAYCVRGENNSDEHCIVFKKEDYVEVLIQVTILGLTLGLLGFLIKEKAIEILALILLPVSVVYPLLEVKAYNKTKYSPFKPTLNHLVLWVTFIFTKSIYANILLGIISVIFETKKVSIKETVKVKNIAHSVYYVSLVMAATSLVYQASKNVKTCFFIIIGTAAGVLCSNFFTEKVIKISIGVGVASFLVLLAYV